MPQAHSHQIPISTDHTVNPQTVSKLEQLVWLFNDEFREEQTLLRYGAEEPFYQAHQQRNNTITPAIIHSTHDYFSSALHEVAHWCVAGKARRARDDYGYWYAPDGRSYEQQQEFYKVEVKPQALEWAFAMACQHEFQVSLDNLNYAQNFPQQAREDALQFEQAVLSQLNRYRVDGFPARAQRLILRLTNTFGGVVGVGMNVDKDKGQRA